MKIIVISDDVVGEKMAGPGIRAWEMSCELSRFFEVCLMVPEYSPGRLKSDFEIIYYSEKRVDDLVDTARTGDVLIVQGYVLHKFRELTLLEKFIVVDLYVPFVLENMFNYRYKLKSDDLNRIYKNDLDVYNQQLKRGDLFLVANSQQFNLIAGGLLLLGLINPEKVSETDGQFNSILEIPFGFRERENPGSRSRLKEKIGFKKSDFVLLWGGVITNWFDPITLIRSMGLIRDSHPDIKLLFLSTTHANPLLPEFDMAKIALGKARELGVYERTVFFNENWIPYEKRTDYFGAADVGVSTHSIHLETRYSFRTRFLEYLNFDLPMVSTEGDHLSGVLRERGALVTVKENDVNGLKEVILRLHSDEVFYNNMVKAVKGIKVRYTWEQVLRPLVERLKMMDASSIEKVRPGTQPVENADNRILRFLKRRCPFLKRFKNKPFFIKIGRYLGR